MDNTAVIVESLSRTGPFHYSYSELATRYKELAHTIQQLTLANSLHIGVYCENSFELVLSLLSILSIGHIYVPLTPNNIGLITQLHIPLVLVRAELLTQYLEFALEPLGIYAQCSNYGIIICRYTSYTGEHITCSPTEQSSTLYDLFSLSTQSNFSPTPLPFQPSCRIAYVLQSSGTTGEPKIIRVPHASLIPNILDISRLFSLSRRDICFLSAPPTFDPSLVQILTSLTSGSTLLIPPTPPCIPYPYLLTKHNITILQSTPSLLYTFSLTKCMQLLGPTSPLRVLAFGGENCPPVSTLRRWQHPLNRTHLYNLYGITEVSCWATYHRLHLDVQSEWNEYNCSNQGVMKREFDDISTLSDLVPIGLPLSETRVELREVRPGDILGEIWVGGASRRCEVGEDMGGDMRNTGDLGIRGIKGGIYCLGRKDKQLKRLGHRMNLLSVERYIRRIAGVESCVLRRDKGKIISYLVTGSEWMDVRKRIQEEIPSKYRPDLIRFLPTIPMTPHGKLDTHSLLSSHPLTSPTLSEAVKEFFSNELSILSLTPSTLPLSQMGVDSFELVSLSTRLQDLVSQYSHLDINDVFESLYDFLSAHPSITLSDTITQRLESRQHDIPNKRSRIDSTYKLPTPDTSHCSTISIRRGRISCSLESLPSSILPPPNPVHLSPAWSHDMGQCVDASPLLCYHPISHKLTLYIGSHSRNFSALSASDGSTLWSTDLADRVESSAVLSRCGRYVVVGCYSGEVYVLEVEGGGVHWVFSTGSEPVKSSPCVDPSTGLVWVGTHSATLLALCVNRKMCVYCVDTSSGSCYSSPLVDTGLRAVYIGTHGGDLIRVSGGDGSIKWRCGLSMAIFSSPALLPDHSLLVGSAGGWIYCVSSEGVVKWKYEASGPVFSSACVVELSQALYVFIGTHNRHVLSLNSRGEREWEYQTDSDIFSIPFALPCYHGVNGSTQLGIIAVAMIDGTILLLNFAGAPLCSYKLPSEVFSSPAMAGTRLFVGCRDNNVYCLDISTDV